ncbi:polygalacturonase inhibitor-like [Syzygium oleosum]|uniref:polygalacturonase inhibitor-like n=1 Tax=Syzygium oleosum TaxID=219896 RepID=UPI0011D2B1C3|nr:polygalacturonase inhibitor-like [Syzygium oleosum]
MASPNLSSAFLFTLLLSSFLVSPSFSELCNPQDKKVLLSIKQSLNNPYILASWKADTDCCDWYCVACDDTTHRITQLTIFDGTLSGQIPAAVGDLPYLQMIDLNRLSHVTGPIPSSLGKLQDLTFLRLSYLNLTGSIPSTLGMLSKLTLLDLSHNDLTGSIPNLLSRIPKLRYLGLDGNRLTGTIPESLKLLDGNLPYLVLSDNRLSGEVPASFRGVNFGYVDLAGNMLRGDGSVFFGANKTTEKINLSGNAFEFDLSRVEFQEGLIGLDLSHNRIFGSIPEGIVKLELESLNLSYNALCGKIPAGGQMQNFGYESYFHNRCLCGAPLESCK